MVTGPGQYPYELFAFTAGSGGVPDANGDPIPLNGSETNLGYCRDEVNNKGNYVTVADGSAYKYDFLICCPLDTLVPKVGQEIEVKNGDQIRVKGAVSRVDVAQFHTRIWL